MANITFIILAGGWFENMKKAGRLLCDRLPLAVYVYASACLRSPAIIRPRLLRVASF